MSNIKSLLRRWGKLYGGDSHGQGYAPQSPIARAMMPGQALGTKWRPEGLQGDDAEMMDLDRAINQLPDDLRSVVIAEYTVAGTYKDRCAAVDMRRSTYYRELKRARQILEVVEAWGQVSGSLAVDELIRHTNKPCKSLQSSP